MRVGTEEGLSITDKEGDAEHWMNAVAPAVLQLHRFWRERRREAAVGEPSREPIIRVGIGNAFSRTSEAPVQA